MRRRPPHVLRIGNVRLPVYSRRWPEFALVVPDADRLRRVLDALGPNAEALEVHIRDERELWALCTWRDAA